MGHSASENFPKFAQQIGDAEKNKNTGSILKIRT
jgi:hypothetical protein